MGRFTRKTRSFLSEQKMKTLAARIRCAKEETDAEMPSKYRERVRVRTNINLRAVLDSMTREEKRDPNIVLKEKTRIQRIARGSGVDPKLVGDYLKSFCRVRRDARGLLFRDYVELFVKG